VGKAERIPSWGCGKTQREDSKTGLTQDGRKNLHLKVRGMRGEPREKKHKEGESTLVRSRVLCLVR